MAVNVQAGAKNATSTKANAGKSAKSSSASKNSFDDTLGKLSDEGKETFVPENTQGSKAASVDTDAPKADMSQDSADVDKLAADIAAAENAAANVAQTATTEQGIAGESLAPVAEAAEQSTATQQVMNLQTLLPQSDADAAKSQDFLAMLSGQQLKGAQSAQNLGATDGRELGRILEGVQTAAQATETTTSASTEPQTIVDISSPLTLLNATKNASTATILEAQLATTQQSDLQAQAGQATLAGAADSELAAVVTTSVADSETITTTVPQVVAQATQAQPEEGTSISTLLGDKVTVEEDIEPLRVAREAAMADNSAMNNGNSEGESAGSQLGSSAREVPVAAESESAPAVATNGTGANTQISSFQQSLQDSILGTSDTQATQTQQSQQTQDSYEITRQIVDQARLIRRGEDTQMVIKLNPEHLGELTLKVSVTANGSVNASFHSDNAAVRTIIENSLVQLKQELNEQGLKVDSVDVYAALDGGLPQDQGQQAWQNGESSQGQASYRGLGVDADDYEAQADDLAAVAAEAAGTGVATTDGVDYRI